MVLAATVASVAVAVLPRRLAPPVVVVELLLGILIGPQGLGIADVDDFIQFFSNLGLGMLFFFAGYEIDFDRIRGRPLTLGACGLGSLARRSPTAIGGILAAAGVVLSLLYTGSAMATTAIGTLIPVLRDSGELQTRFGTYLLAAGAIGEFGPILLVTLVLSTNHPLHEAAILVAFIVLALVIAVSSVRLAWRGWPLLERTLEASSQLAVRIAVLLIFSLVALASELGLDVLLGGFVGRDDHPGRAPWTRGGGARVEADRGRLRLPVPFFFVTSGMNFDLDALASSVGAMLKLPLFLGLFLVVRGLPAMLLYRGVMDARERMALAFFSATELPLVVAITTIATQTGHMRSTTAAALVGAAMLSTLIFPFIGLALRRTAAPGASFEAPALKPG